MSEFNAMDQSNNQAQVEGTVYNAAMLPDMLPVYYKRLFPHKHFYRWLSYGLSEPNMFTNREISFTLHDDIYMRYLCFDNQIDMEREICSKVPYKIDIGAVMSVRPSMVRIGNSTMVPFQRELVFDIDMTDYDDVRTCCSGTAICQKCWKFMAVAARILDVALRDDFGFEHILWVFSGRRGIHCWVCDYEARHLDTRGRTAVAEYLQFMSRNVVGDGNMASMQYFGDRTHHSIKRALKLIEPVFDEIIVEDQNVFGMPSGLNKLLSFITDDVLRTEADAFLRAKTHSHSRDIWSAFVLFAHSLRTSSAAQMGNRKTKHLVAEVQLRMLYPRLDINVSKGFNHLLKAPFCIHPGTGKVCVPFNCNAGAKFDPTTVPTIGNLLQEINAFDVKTKEHEADESSRIKDYKKTSMFKGVLVFEEFLRKLEGSFKMKMIDVSDQKMCF